MKFPVPKGPVALSLSGGGAKGDWTLGHIDWLRTVAGLTINVVLGTSTGALSAAKIGALLATGDERHWVDLKKIYTNVVTDNIIEFPGVMKHILSHNEDGQKVALLSSVVAGNPSVYSVEPLRLLIDRHMPEELWKRLISAGKRKRKPIEVGFCFTDFATGESKVVTNITHPDPAILRSALLASACQPVLMPMTRVAGMEYCSDGGVRDVNPVRFIYETKPVQEGQVDAIIAVYVDSHIPIQRRDEYRNIISTLGRTIELLNCNTIEGDINQAKLWNLVLYLREQLQISGQWNQIERNVPPDLAEMVSQAGQKKYIPLYSVYPPEALPGSPLDFNPKLSKKRIFAGFQHARKVWAYESIQA